MFQGAIDALQHISGELKWLVKYPFMKVLIVFYAALQYCPLMPLKPGVIGHSA